MRRLIPGRGLRPSTHLGLSSRFVARRNIHIQAIPNNQLNSVTNENFHSASTTTNSAISPDAKFEVIGSPYSLLSVSLSASQNLFTRRGTLVGLSGKAENVVSTLRILEPFRRAALGIPFLYQRISSTSPVSALVSVQSPVTSLALLQLNGTVDWMLAQRKALLAWTGHSLTIKPRFNNQLSLTHWGNSEVTGRGLIALVGKGQIYSIDLKDGEQYIAHPSNVVAYTMTPKPPQPYRFKSTTLRFQVPNLGVGKRLSKTNLVSNLSKSDTWMSVMRIFHTLRTWTRRTIWGDRFQGPTTLLVQSRAARINDILADHEVNEIADATPGVTRAAVEATAAPSPEDVTSHQPPGKDDHPRPSIASVHRDGKVDIRPTE
ncbi:Altered inheritance of mitochondria protein 24, mitochondrial [Arthroderma sp. PD_2]|nr:Altered inheritance of mitochondria protein 24, mitochondrial [Arthroderma sp. PD_2]